MSQRSRLSQQQIPYAPHSPEILPVVEQRDHLEIEGGHVRCQECSAPITVDSSYPHTEYGHVRLKHKRKDGQGRCKHRPEGVDTRREW